MSKDLNIVLVRVDSRLVHGQILEAWVPHVRAKCIIVVDNKVAGDSFFETIIRMAVPSHIELIVSSVDDFVKNYNFTHGDGKNTIVLFSNIADACDAFSRGFHFDKLNIGNVYNNEYKICCSPSVFLCDREIECIKKLSADPGIVVELKTIPKGKGVDIKDALKGC